MKLWLVRRDDDGWDEYDAFIVRAEDAEAARTLAAKKEPGRKGWDAADWQIEELAVEGEATIVLGSFNAG